MKSYQAYCAACDSQVHVRLDPEAEHPLEGADVRCLDRCPSCEGVVCPLEDASPRELGERLEFLPHEAHEADERTDVDPEELLKRARIQAMRRGNDPVH